MGVMVVTSWRRGLHKGRKWGGGGPRWTAGGTASGDDRSRLAGGRFLSWIQLSKIISNFKSTFVFIKLFSLPEVELVRVEAVE